MEFGSHSKKALKMTAQADEDQRDRPDPPPPPPPPPGERDFRAFGTPESFRENITRLN